MGFFSIYLLSTGLIANFLINPLEQEYPPLKEITQVDAIVILTNGVKDLSHLGLSPRPDSRSLERTHHGYVLYRRSKNTPIIVSGGRADPSKPTLSIGASLGNALLELGMPKKDLTVEDDSLNTSESASRVAEILKSKGKTVILVTSGYHMGRATRLYKKAGFTVIPAPTNFLGGPVLLGLHSFIPQAQNLETSSTALYEYFCGLWYTIAGVFS